MKAELQTWHKGVHGLSFFGCGYAPPGSSVLLTRKSFAGRKRFFFAKSSRSSRLRGESWLDFHREGAKKKRRTLVWLRLCRSVFICGLILCGLRRRKPLPA